MAEIKLENVKKAYGDDAVVKGIDIEVRDREFLVLVGPSGCGKSTTLRMIAGLEDVTDGVIKIDDKIVNDVEPKDRDVAMVFQNYALYPHMSVYDNMAFSLKLKKMDKGAIDKKVREVAYILKLEGMLKKFPKSLSGGQKQRVALGRAMVRNPKVFLMDEPLSNLDAKLRTEMRAQISKLHKDLDATFVYVTHDQTEAMTMGDRIVVMQDGEVKQVDSPENIYNRPLNKFVAGFIGSPQMNFLDVVARDKGGVVLEIGGVGSTLNLNDDIGKKIKSGGYIGSRLILGIRPEDVYSVDDVADIASMDAKVSLKELTGSETYIYFDLGGSEIIAKFDSRKNIPDKDMMKIAFDTDKIHIFDKESEENILL